MEPFTPAERRGALLVALLLALGAGYDLWRAGRPRPDPGTGPATLASVPGDAPDPGAAGPDPWPAGRAHVRPVDLNRASARELDALPGVGMVLSARIVAHRERHGPFRRVEELLAVRGIGPRLFARIAPLVTVDEAGPAAAPDRAPAPEPPGDRRPPSAP